MNKRVSVRGILLDGDSVWLMYRRKTKEGNVNEFYVPAGGGVEDGEDFVTTLMREMKEEFSVEIKDPVFIETTEDDKSITHFYKCNILNGIPKLGGPELERLSSSNYYEVRKIKVSDLDEIDIWSRDIIKRAYKEAN